MNKEKLNIGIFTNDYHKALKFFTDLYHNKRREIDFYVNTKTIQEIILLNSTQYLWINLIDNSKEYKCESVLGYRCDKAYIDKSINEELIEEVIIPTLCHSGRIGTLKEAMIYF
jgi:hypothetical protein